MLEQLLRHLRNYFVTEKYFGNFVIEGGSLELPFLQNGQYYRIVGSVFNDGIYKYEDNAVGLTNETFDGAVWALAIPVDVINLAAEIAEWQTEHGTASPYESESFAGYSYKRAVGKSGNSVTWQDVFANQLNAWRKI